MLLYLGFFNSSVHINNVKIENLQSVCLLFKITAFSNAYETIQVVWFRAIQTELTHYFIHIYNIQCH